MGSIFKFFNSVWYAVIGTVALWVANIVWPSPILVGGAIGFLGVNWILEVIDRKKFQQQVRDFYAPSPVYLAEYATADAALTEALYPEFKGSAK